MKNWWWWRWDLDYSDIPMYPFSSALAGSDQILTLHISYSFFFSGRWFLFSFGLYFFFMSKNQKKFNRLLERIKLIYIFKFCWIVCFILLLGISKSCKITDRGPVLDTLQIFLTGNLYYFNVYAIYISISTYSLYHNYIFSQRSFKNKTILYCSYLHN